MHADGVTTSATGIVVSSAEVTRTDGPNELARRCAWFLSLESGTLGERKPACIPGVCWIVCKVNGEDSSVLHLPFEAISSEPGASGSRICRAGRCHRLSIL